MFAKCNYYPEGYQYLSFLSPGEGGLEDFLLLLDHVLVRACSGSLVLCNSRRLILSFRRFGVSPLW
jgi:hypothetical protein